jgi:hypothetical protein
LKPALLAQAMTVRPMASRRSASDLRGWRPFAPVLGFAFA